MFKIYPYRQNSRSARLLANTLGCAVLRREGSRYVPQEEDTVINWGSVNGPDFRLARVLNHDIINANNKLWSFQVFREANVSIPQFWERLSEIPNDAFPILSRTILRGYSGIGIHYCSNREAIVNAPLYVKYVKKAEEYRVHVVHGNIILIQRKARKHDVENVDWHVRNLAGGFVFVLVDQQRVPPDALEQSIMAVRALGLDFGAVDIIWNRQQNRSYVLEVNCAPGLEQRTADAYAEAFR